MRSGSLTFRQMGFFGASCFAGVSAGRRYRLFPASTAPNLILLPLDAGGLPAYSTHFLWWRAGMLLFGIRDCLKLSSAGVIFLALSFSCPAQTSRVASDIQGSIADQSGSAIAGARVTLRNQGTNQTRRMLTEARGFFPSSRTSGRSVRTTCGIARVLYIRR